MSDTFHEATVAKSRKVRQCTWCGEKINVGDPYEAYSFRDGGDFGRVTMHPECHKAMGEVSREEGGWFTWSIGDFTRGCGCPSGDCQCSQ